VSPAPARSSPRRAAAARPIPLLAAGETLLGQHDLTGDTTTGINETVPSCNATSTAPELVYTFTITAADGPLGIDARSSGFDTVLHLRSACNDAGSTLACTDDSAPPGDFGSRVAALLAPGTYYLLVDGFDGSSKGPFDLSVRFASNCVPACDGRFCGNTDGLRRRLRHLSVGPGVQRLRPLRRQPLHPRPATGASAGRTAAAAAAATAPRASSA
jgi:hypothetical protein